MSYTVATQYMECGGVVGNTALQPEESISRDIGIRYAMASLPIEIDLGYFDIDIKTVFFLTVHLRSMSEIIKTTLALAKPRVWNFQLRENCLILFRHDFLLVRWIPLKPTGAACKTPSRGCYGRSIWITCLLTRQSIWNNCPKNTGEVPVRC